MIAIKHQPKISLKHQCITDIDVCFDLFRISLKGLQILLMEEIPNNHLGCIKPWKSWDKRPIKRCRISAINGLNLHQEILSQPKKWGAPTVKSLKGFRFGSWCWHRQLLRGRPPMWGMQSDRWMGTKKNWLLLLFVFTQYNIHIHSLNLCYVWGLWWGVPWPYVYRCKYLYIIYIYWFRGGIQFL